MAPMPSSSLPSSGPKCRQAMDAARGRQRAMPGGALVRVKWRVRA